VILRGQQRPGFQPIQFLVGHYGNDICCAQGERFSICTLVGVVLATAVALLMYYCLQKTMIVPLRKLQTRVETSGLDSGLADQELGELASLSRVLEEATLQLIQSEDDKLADIQTELSSLGEDSSVQSELLRYLLRDLRTSMSSVLGHAELLVTGDTRPADRINLIRAIQGEARRLSRLAGQLQELLPSSRHRHDIEKKLVLPIERLREVIEQLRSGDSKPISFHQLGSGQVNLEARGSPEGGGTKHEVTPEEAPLATRLSGSILVVGRKNECAKALISELHEIGLEAVWVPDAAGAESELAGGDHHMVVVNLSKPDRCIMDLPARLSRMSTQEPVIALLAANARGDGDRYLKLGCSDYIYAPISRRKLLAIVGKYLDFKPIS